MTVMICCCALAGTSACEHCNRKAEYEFKLNDAPSVGYKFKIEPVSKTWTKEELKELVKETVNEILGEKQ